MIIIHELDITHSNGLYKITSKDIEGLISCGRELEEAKLEAEKVIRRLSFKDIKPKELKIQVLFKEN